MNLRIAKNLYMSLKNPALHKESFKIFNFHVVSDSPDYIFDSSGICTPVNSFQRAIDYIEANFTIVPLSDGIRHLENDNFFINKKPVCSLTFDDGDIYLEKNVIPYLSLKNIPATFFVNLGHQIVESASWYHVIRYLFSRKIPNPLFAGPEHEKIISLLRYTRNKDDYSKVSFSIDLLRHLYKDIHHLFLPISFMQSQNNSALFSFENHSFLHHRHSLLEREESFIFAKKNHNILNDLGLGGNKHFAYPFGTKIDISKQNIYDLKKFGLIQFSATGGDNITNNAPLLNRISLDGPNALEKVRNVIKSSK